MVLLYMCKLTKFNIVRYRDIFCFYNGCVCAFACVVRLSTCVCLRPCVHACVHTCMCTCVHVSMLCMYMGTEVE